MAFNPFDNTDTEDAPFDPFAAPAAGQGRKQNTGIAGDIGTALKQGVERLPGTLTGLADMVVAPLSTASGVKRPFSRGADWLGEQTGFQPGKWADAAEREYSPEYQAEAKRVGDTEGFLGALGEAARSPRFLAGQVAQALPGTLLGGLAARGAMGAVMGAERLAATRAAAAAGDAAARGALLKAGAVAGGIGEGAITAGQQMSQTGYDVDPLKAAGTALGAGAVTLLIGTTSGRLANRLGLPDLDAAIAVGTRGNPARKPASTIARRVGLGAPQEGAEEMLQSGQEQVWQNLANDRPWDEGVGQAAAVGALVGGAMSGGFNAMPRSVSVPRGDGGTTQINADDGPISAAVVAGINRSNAAVSSAVEREVSGRWGAPALPAPSADSYNPAGPVLQAGTLGVGTPEQMTKAQLDDPRFAAMIQDSPLAGMMDRAQERADDLTARTRDERLRLRMDDARRTRDEQDGAFYYEKVDLPSRLSLVENREEPVEMLPFVSQKGPQAPAGWTLHPRDTPPPVPDGQRALANQPPGQSGASLLSRPRTHAEAIAVATKNQVQDARILSVGALRDATAGEGTRTTRQEGGLIETIGKLFGKRVVFYESSAEAPEGLIRTRDSKTIYLNANAKTSAMAVFGHELAHQIRSETPHLWAPMAKVIGKALGYSGMEKAYRDYYGADRKRLAEIDTAVAGKKGKARAQAVAAFFKETSEDGQRNRFVFTLEEAVSDLTGNRFREADFWRATFQEVAREQGQSAVRRLANRIMLAVARVVRAIRGHGFKADEFVDAKALDQIRVAIRTAVKDYHLYQRNENAYGYKETGYILGGVRSETGEVGSDAGKAKFAGPGRGETQTAFLEAVPSEKTRAGKAIGELDAARKTEFTEHVFSKVDPAEVARQVLGRKDVRVTALNSTGGYLPEASSVGKISPNVLVQAEPTGDRPVTLAEAERLGQALNYVYTQDGVPVSRYDEALHNDPKATDVVRFPLPALVEGHTVSAQEEAFYRTLEKVYGLGIGYSKIDGKIVVGNYVGLDQNEFFKLAGEVARETGVNFEATAAEGTYVYHDWQADPNGDRHEVWGNADSTGRPDLQARLHDWRNRAVQAAAGWLEERGIRYSPGRYDARSDAAGDRRDRGDVQAGLRRSVQPESVSAVGIHYSRQPRERLDSSYFGTGIRGAEAGRVAEAADPRIKQRLYFYVNSGRPIRPEEGVGSHAHLARLDNLYDYSNDPLDLRVNNTPSGFESAVLDKGFDGYVTHEFGIAVLLGPRSLAVEYLGQNDRPEVPPAERAAPSDFGKQQRAVAANPALPAGEMTGADWKRLLPKLMPGIDVSHLDDEQRYYKDGIVKRPEAAKPSTSRLPGAGARPRTPETRTEGDEGPDIRFSPQRLATEFEGKLAEHFRSRQPQPVKLSANTPASLQLFGWKDLPIVVTPNVIDKMHFDHGMTLPQMARLPYLLKRPLMIFADNANKSLVLVGEHLASGKIALVAVKPEVTAAATDGQGPTVYARTNLIVTGYAPQNGWAEVVKRIARGELVYRDTEEAPPAIVRAALAVAQKRGAQSGRTLPREVLQGSTVRPVLGRGYSVLGQSDLVKLEGAIWPEGAKFSGSRATLGPLTPAQETAANRVLGAPKTFAERLQGFRQDWAQNLKQGVFDQFAPLQDLDPNAYILARLSKGGDSTLEALMLYGKLFVGADGATDVRYTRAGGLQGFASKMAKLNGEHDRFLLWVAAQRADRLKAIGLENLWLTDDITVLKTLNTGKMKDGTPRAGLYAQALEDLNEFNDNVLEVAVASGLIDEATRQMYRGLPYVPFYRLQEDDTVSGFNIKPGLVNQYAWKRLKGGTQKLNEDLLANLLHNWSHLITASARNRAARAALQAAERAGVAVRVPGGAPGKGRVSFKDAGREAVFVVNDPHLMDAVTALEYAGLGAWAKPFATAKHWLTLGVTANPSFKLRNLIRDTLGALGTAQLSYNVPGNLARGWAATAKDSETRAHLLAAGGMIRFGSMLDGKDSQRAQDLINQGVDPAMILDDDTKIKAFWKRYVRPALNAYNELGDRGEQITRAALYEQMRAKGMSHAEAAFWARDLMDFSMSGKWTAIRTITQTVPFFNARLQGLYKLGRAGTQDIRRLGYVLGAVSMASLALLMAYEDDDDWKARSDPDRNNYWWFKVGGVAFRVPKPFEIGAIGTLAERLYEWMASDEMTGERFGRNVRDLVMSQLSMNPTPQLFKPMMDLYANQDSFTGKNIESASLQRLRKVDRYDDRTSEVARFLGGLGLPDPSQLVMGRWETLSPKQMDFLTKAYFSWLGTMTTTALDYGIRPMLDRGARPALSLREVFLVGSFVETLPSNGSRYVQQMYDQAREIEQAYASYHARLKVGDAGGAKAILADEGDKIRRHAGMQNLLRAESLLNLQLQRIAASTTLSSDEKRERLDQVHQRRNQLARNFQQATRQ